MFKKRHLGLQLLQQFLKKNVYTSTEKEKNSKPKRGLVGCTETTNISAMNK